MIRSELTPISSAGHWMLPRPFASRRMRNRNSLGTASVSRPRKSLICVEAMRMAMPFVKPMVTGRGMYFTAVP
jgi:hypothetical protein